MSIDKAKYVAKIASANKKDLIIIHFDIIIDYLEESKNYTKEKTKKLDFNIKKARQFLAELRCSINNSYELSAYLNTMYDYIDTVICKYLFNKDINTIDEAINILNNIKKGFNDIKYKDETKVMENTHSIYAGLTYSKDGSLDEYVDTDINRGFKA